MSIYFYPSNEGARSRSRLTPCGKEISVVETKISIYISFAACLLAASESVCAYRYIHNMLYHNVK